jgi:hypothetical protein
MFLHKFMMLGRQGLSNLLMLVERANVTCHLSAKHL